MCMSILPTCMSLCHMLAVPTEGRMGAVSFRSKVIDSCVVMWVLGMKPKETVFLTT